MFWKGLGEACSSAQFPKAGSSLLKGIPFCLICSQNRLVIKKTHPPLVISSGAHLGFDSQCGEFPQCDARRGYIQNIPFTGGMVKKIGDKTCISHLSGIQTPSDPG